ncbi:unnamed protein product [Lymnaea stagnalis]|uniref:Macro domain-containing protein n=1 Tax=Lymnaea stagnalis TaxID=6523 RepID=A0AAV2IQ77_LYMST
MEEKPVFDRDVIYHLRDINQELVTEWTECFKAYPTTVKPSHGDICVGAPAADAIVCPGNSFGFMGKGAMDSAIINYFGQDIQDNLQEVIRDEYEGELLVGQAVILGGLDRTERNMAHNWSNMNQGDPITYLITAPTVRVPQNVSTTPNAYLAFRAVILAVRKHNLDHKTSPIRQVLVPGLVSGGGRMPVKRCAMQMLEAYETHVQTKYPSRLNPTSLSEMSADHVKMCSAV